MYKLLISKLLKHILYVTITFQACLTYADEPAQEKKLQAKKYVKELGANSYKQRKAAIKALIKLGYFARSEVRTVLNSSDPEVKENAKLVWEKIRWSITENNPELVNNFISKFHKGKVTLNDWVSLVEQCEEDSLEVMFELAISKIPKQKKEGPDIEDDPFGDADPFEKSNKGLSLPIMISTIVNNTEQQTLIKTISEYDKKRVIIFSEISKAAISQSTPYIQSRLLNLCTSILKKDQSWKIYNDECEINSYYVRKKLSPDLLEYVKNNYKTFNAESQIRAYLVLFSHNLISLEQISKELPVNSFHQCSNEVQKTFYKFLESRLTKDSKIKLLKNGNEAWHKYHLMALQKLPEQSKIIEVFSKTFAKGGDIVKFIQENFALDSEQAIPFHLIASEIENKNNDWFLYSTSTILMNHYHRIGEYQKAIKYLRMFNAENERQQDTNESFYIDQEKLIKPETKELLLKCQALAKAAPKKAIELFDKAEKLNPGILTIKIQKLECLRRLKQFAKAKEYLSQIYDKVPDNIIEIRDLVYLSWEFDSKEIAQKLIDKLNISEENFDNLTLASSSFEFFLNMEKTKELQQKIGLNSFAQTRHFFYEKNYDPIPALCKKPDEGDFQYIWGVMALKISKGAKEANKYFSHRVFDDKWPEMLGLALIGKLSPEEIIEEAKSALNLTERKGRLTEAYYYAACYSMSEGNKLKAKEYFKKSLALSFYEYYEYVSAKVMLQKLN